MQLELGASAEAVLHRVRWSSKGDNGHTPPPIAHDHQGLDPPAPGLIELE
jgi:hypothetical protein